VVVDPVRVSAQLVVRALEAGTAPVRELARLGSDSLLTALLAVLGGADRDQEQQEPPGAVGDETGMSPAEVINRGLLAGHGRYTRLEVADRAGISSEQARRLWRAVGFPEADDDQRVFTSADVAALTDAAGLLAAEVLDTDGLVERPAPSATCFPASPRPRRVSSPTYSGRASRPNTSPRIPRRPNRWRPKPS